MKTDIHPIYEEAVEKIFEKPIKIDALVDQPDRSKNFGQFGIDQMNQLEVLIQPRDLIDKNLKLSAGDFFVFGEETFEVSAVNELNNIFGQDEYGVQWKIVGTLARTGQLDVNTFRQLLRDAKIFKESEVQKNFEQQRGYKETDTHGNTGDIRQVRERLKDDMAPIALGEGPREVIEEENEQASTFDNDSDTIYDDL